MIDNYALWVEHDAKQQEWLSKRPVCDCCKEPIQESEAFYYADQWFCKYGECEQELMKLIWEDIRSDYLVPVEE